MAPRYLVYSSSAPRGTELSYDSEGKENALLGESAKTPPLGSIAVRRRVSIAKRWRCANRQGVRRLASAQPKGVRLEVGSSWERLVRAAPEEGTPVVTATPLATAMLGALACWREEDSSVRSSGFRAANGCKILTRAA